MNRGFTTLIGSQWKSAQVGLIADRLVDIAMYAGFSLPTAPDHSREPPFRSGWTHEVRMPTGDHVSAFSLVVLAPDVPGISPINPFTKPHSGPLFAVNICRGSFFVWQEFGGLFSSGDFLGCKTETEIESSFSNFIGEVIRQSAKREAAHRDISVTSAVKTR